VSRGVIALLALVVAGPAAAAELPPLDADLVARGQRVYREHCASCHGADAEGAPNWEEQNEAGELPAPPHGPEGHTWRHPDAELHHMIAEGWRDPFNGTQHLTMPAFGSILSEAEILAVIEYLKSLWTDEQRAFQIRREAERK
jgi:mono/diheme cytochrome c family protein